MAFLSSDSGESLYTVDLPGDGLIDVFAKATVPQVRDSTTDPIWLELANTESITCCGFCCVAWHRERRCAEDVIPTVRIKDALRLGWRYISLPPGYSLTGESGDALICPQCVEAQYVTS